MVSMVLFDQRIDGAETPFSTLRTCRARNEAYALAQACAVNDENQWHKNQMIAVASLQEVHDSTAKVAISTKYEFGRM